MKTRRDKRLIPQLSPGDLAQIVERSTISRDRTLVSLHYLSGRRIEEILSLQKKNFDKSENGFLSFITFNEKSWRKNKVGTFRIELFRHFKNYTGIVFYEEIHPKFSLTSPSGKLLSPYIVDYLAALGEEEYLFAPLRVSRREHICSRRAYQILRDLDERLWLHALRHLRFTAYGRAYRDNPVAMHSITFHKRFESTMQYIRPAEVEERLRRI